MIHPFESIGKGNTLEEFIDSSHVELPVPHNARGEEFEDSILSSQNYFRNATMINRKTNYKEQIDSLKSAKEILHLQSAVVNLPVVGRTLDELCQKIDYALSQGLNEFMIMAGDLVKLDKDNNDSYAFETIEKGKTIKKVQPNRTGSYEGFDLSLSPTAKKWHKQGIEAKKGDRGMSKYVTSNIAAILNEVYGDQIEFSATINLNNVDYNKLNSKLDAGIRTFYTQPVTDNASVNELRKVKQHINQYIGNEESKIFAGFLFYDSKRQFDGMVRYSKKLPGLEVPNELANYSKEEFHKESIQYAAKKFKQLFELHQEGIIEGMNLMFMNRENFDAIKAESLQPVLTLPIIEKAANYSI